MKDCTDRYWFETREAAEAAVLERHRGQEGWSVLASDNPVMATCGYAVFRVEDTNGNYLPTPSVSDDLVDHLLFYEWPEAGRRLRPQMSIISPESLLKLVGDGEGYLSCDSPRERRIGFVRHDLEKGLAIIDQADAQDVRQAYDEVKGPLLAAHARAKAARGNGRTSADRAAALHSALGNRA